MHDTAGASVPIGEVGEVVIRGGGVFGGYESPEGANETAFVDGWFRTGDEGLVDDDGYLFLRGRIKEIINRGGEKIGPLEIDAVLVSHPAVAQAVTFGVPDTRLGEEVAAAVVIEPGAEDVTERELQDFVVQQLAPFKVPRKIVFVDEIPKGATGKLQRIGLGDRLGVGPRVPGDAPGDVRPRNALENELEKIWADVLGLPRVGVRDDFFALGGDSILGAEAVARVRDLVGAPDLPLISIVRAPTVEAMVGEIERPYDVHSSGVVPLRSDGFRLPLFFVHGVDGDVVGFAALAARLSSEQPFYALRAPGLDEPGATPDRVEELAAIYYDDIRAVQPRGPYVLGGFCMGAAVAVELARLFTAGEEEVSLLVLLDPRLGPASPPRSLRGRLLGRIRRSEAPIAAPAAGIALQTEPLTRARDAYRPTPIEVPAAILLSPNHDGGLLSNDVARVLTNMTACISVPGNHGRRFHSAGADELARALDPVLAGIPARRA